MTKTAIRLFGHVIWTHPCGPVVVAAALGVYTVDPNDFPNPAKLGELVEIELYTFQVKSNGYSRIDAHLVR